MINADKNLIIANGEDKTLQIEQWTYDKGKYFITYRGGKTYTYNYANVEIDKNPKNLDISNVMISCDGRVFYKVKKVIQFSKYTRIYFQNGSTKTYLNKKLVFTKSILAEKNANNCFHYFKEIAKHVGLKTEECGNILENSYEKIRFIREDSVLASYFLGKAKEYNNLKNDKIMYPFGFNASQKTAVENAMNNQMSIIEGPPGTGKTQTILNIIANAIMSGKSIAVVSSNNEATKNVLEKLNKNKVGFIAAYLGNGKNKKEFIDLQKTQLPEMVDWNINNEEYNRAHLKLVQLSNGLDLMLQSNNKLSGMKQELEAIELEYGHFEEYYNDIVPENLKIKIKNKLKSGDILNLWIKLDKGNKKISFFRKILYFFIYGIRNKRFYAADKNVRIAVCQDLFYKFKIRELEKEISSLECKLKDYDFTKHMGEYSSISMKVFKAKLYEKYKKENQRRQYNMEDLWKKSNEFIKDYPVVLSTTYSLRSSLSSAFTYDYVIVDEASQVDLATGVLALSCAKNAVVVGDLKQLPNVIDDKTKKETNEIFKNYNISDKYNYSKHSLLSSVSEVYNGVSRVMLREHYRCNPQIIGFCNQKFYDNQLLILSEEQLDKNPLVVYKTVAGNHSRNRTNIRQIDVILKEVIPNEKIDINNDSVGVVTPYRNQTEQLKKAFSTTKVKADTVDKFQGQEKDVIILSTVDDEITDFADDPNRLNVAVSRAINQLIVVTDGNESKRNTNIGDLIGYIKYNNFEVIESRVYSIFDYLYKGYEEKRKLYLTKTKQISKYESENLMYTLIINVLKENFNEYDVAVHVPLRMIIRDLKKLSQEEIEYLLNKNTHVDFLIYSKILHQPLLIVEVDGYEFHKKGTDQYIRDQKKNSILEKNNLKYIRLVTNGSGEKEKLIDKLEGCS